MSAKNTKGNKSSVIGSTPKKKISAEDSPIPRKKPFILGNAVDLIKHCSPPQKKKADNISDILAESPKKKTKYRGTSNFSPSS